MEDFGEFSRLSCIRGYHLSKDTWEATVGESLVCEREPSNAEDRYAVSVKQEDNIVGHLTRNISTSRLVFAIALHSKVLDKGSLGSGRPSQGWR